MKKAFLALLLSFCVVVPALAQTKPAPPQPQKPADDQDEVVRITTNLVQVDAVEHALRDGMTIPFDIPVRRSGAFQVRIAVRDSASSHIGSAGQFVAVPNLANKKLAASGVVLGTASDSATRAIANPGTRWFMPKSDVHFAYVIYNATSESGALRNLVMQAKLFRDGKNVYSGPEVPIKAAADQTDLSRVFASGSVPLAPDLEPGGYYLQVVITEVGAKDKVPSVIQWVDFEIEKQKS